MSEWDWLLRNPEGQFTDGRYLLRVGDHNQPFPAEQIQALKAGKRRRVAEVRIVPEASLADLDLSLLERLREHTGRCCPTRNCICATGLPSPVMGG